MRCSLIQLPQFSMGRLRNQSWLLFSPRRGAPRRGALESHRVEDSLEDGYVISDDTAFDNLTSHSPPHRIRRCNTVFDDMPRRQICIRRYATRAHSAMRYDGVIDEMLRRSIRYDVVLMFNNTMSHLTMLHHQRCDKAFDEYVMFDATTKYLTQRRNTRHHNVIFNARA